MPKLLHEIDSPTGSEVIFRLQLVIRKYCRNNGGLNSALCRVLGVIEGDVFHENLSR